jgi:uncharacterized protein (TIGR02145 family)
MRRLFTILLILFVTKSGFSQVENVTFYSNDSINVSKKVFYYTPNIVPLDSDNDTLLVESTDTNVVKVFNKYVKSGQKDSARVVNFGTANIQIKLKNSSFLRKSIKVVVNDLWKNNSNKLAHGQIIQKQNKFQFTQQNELEGIVTTLHTANIEKMSNAVRLAWDVIPDKDKPYSNDSIVQFVIPCEDSTKIYMRCSGNHSIILTATDGTRIDTIASYNYTRVGDDFFGYEYINMANSIVYYINQNPVVLPFEKNYDGFAQGRYYYHDSILGLDFYDEDSVRYYVENVNDILKIIDLRDGERYDILTSENWMLSNLRWFPEGYDFQNSKPSDNGTTKEYYVDGHTGTSRPDVTKLRTNGVIYNKAAITGNSNTLQTSTTHRYRGPCPKGWSVPDRSDCLDPFDDIFNIVSLTADPSNNFGWDLTQNDGENKLRTLLPSSQNLPSAWQPTSSNKDIYNSNRYNLYTETVVYNGQTQNTKGGFYTSYFPEADKSGVVIFDLTATKFVFYGKESGYTGAAVRCVKD